jgi:peptidoglycan/xylan/chitin deacetylase (PgdA/CDA1 family)
MGTRVPAIAIGVAIFAAVVASASAGEPTAPPPADHGDGDTDAVSAPDPSATATDAGAPAAETVDAGPLDPMAIDPILGHAQRVGGTETTGLVAFTFDDGPEPKTTPRVIAALERYDVPASFFLVARRLAGKLGASSRELALREDHEGFLVGCHSWSHKNLKRSNAADAKREVDAAQKEIAEVLGRPIGLFRPPYGELGGAALVDIQKRGLTEVLWSIDTLDWRAHDLQKLRKKVLHEIIAGNGGVVLMHDTKEITAHVIPLVLDDLEAENCARIARGDEPIVPVSLHYFLKDGKRWHGGGKARPVPAEVAARTASYESELPGRCLARAWHVEP